MAKSRLFGTKIDPSCSYCEWGMATNDGQMILCEQRGVVAPYSSCKKFIYAPLKRVPTRTAPLMEFSAKDFEL